jgi:hypothetical protein
VVVRVHSGASWKAPFCGAFLLKTPAVEALGAVGLVPRGNIPTFLPTCGNARNEQQVRSGQRVRTPRSESPPRHPSARVECRQRDRESEMVAFAKAITVVCSLFARREGGTRIQRHGEGDKRVRPRVSASHDPARDAGSVSDSLPAQLRGGRCFAKRARRWCR